MKMKRQIHMPSDEEDAAINRGIAEDPDTYEVSDEQFKRMRRRGARDQPRLETPKVVLSIQFDADIVERFKSTGDGWQTRMNDALREWLKDHEPA